MLIDIVRIRWHLIQWPKTVIGIIEVGIDDGEADCIVLEVLINLLITLAILVFRGIRTLLEHNLDVAKRFAIVVAP